VSITHNQYLNLLSFSFILDISICIALASVARWPSGYYEVGLAISRSWSRLQRCRVQPGQVVYTMCLCHQAV